MGWTTPKTWLTNDVVPASDKNTYIRDNTNFLFRPPAALLTHSTSQDIPAGQTTALTFDTVVRDSHGMYSADQPRRLTIKVAGLYLFWGYWRGNIDSGASGAVSFLVNGTAGVVGAKMPPQTFADFANGMAMLELVVDDYVECTALHESGTNPIGISTNSLSPRFGAIFQAG